MLVTIGIGRTSHHHVSGYSGHSKVPCLSGLSGHLGGWNSVVEYADLCLSISAPLAVGCSQEVPELQGCPDSILEVRNVALHMSEHDEPPSTEAIEIRLPRPISFSTHLLVCASKCSCHRSSLSSACYYRLSRPLRLALSPKPVWRPVAKLFRAVNLLCRVPVIVILRTRPTALCTNYDKSSLTWVHGWAGTVPRELRTNIRQAQTLRNLHY